MIESLSLPGDPAKPNEDAFARRGRAAVVMDGATGLGELLMPGNSDAAWVARFGANRLMAHSDEGLTPHDAVIASLRDTENSFVNLRRRAPAETYEIPFSSMMFVTLSGSGFDALWFGDCAVLVARPGGVVELVGDAMEKRSRESGRAAALAAKLGESAASAGVRDTFLPALRATRNQMNTGRRSWCFGPDARAADHVASARVSAPIGTILLLVSDGFLALASDYNRYDATGLMHAARTRGLGTLGDELREIEAGDPDGARFPRFKKSDDATALLLRIV
ncbi:MAG: hypothetical protein ABSC92_01800 [Rhizomicrobium sp.]|jgi:hypothetical protein